MSGSIDRRQLFFIAIAGLAGGAIGWLPVELASHNSHLGEVQTTAEMVAYYISSAFAAGSIGAFITAVGGSELQITQESKRRFIRGFVLCALLSLLSTYLGNFVFNLVLAAGGVRFSESGQIISGSIVTLVIARLFGWAIDGALVGAGVGLATLTILNVPKGALGGLVGGAVGGISFDSIGAIFGGGLASRFFGEAATGLAIGLFIGLVQELTKDAWLAVEAGRLSGRQFRLERPTVTLGRAEENLVGLFGDPRVQARHAVITRQGDSWEIKNLAVQAGTTVNGHLIESAPLADGDTIKIGDYVLSFHLRQGSAARVGRPDAPAFIHTPRPETAVSSGAHQPHLLDGGGRRYALREGGATRLGRALDNDIVVSHPSVSRHHAEIVASNGGFELRDLQSQNGTFLGGRRVKEARISDGDTVALGDAPFTFHA
jgi:pSer/pThr/pTyr-binding forkhead associated (FHA) protein